MEYTEVGRLHSDLGFVTAHGAASISLLERVVIARAGYLAETVFRAAHFADFLGANNNLRRVVKRSRRNGAGRIGDSGGAMVEELSGLFRRGLSDDLPGLELAPGALSFCERGG